ncbi:MAG: cytidylate kinase-like family protein [Prevotellaceae bacterium]|nr:cytidylate kinase-like family protein [Prevotellaceae bacterium]
MNKNFSITVGRELGSGGRVIARLLAERFGCNFYDKEILTLAAKESGFSEKLFENHDELHSRLHNLIFNKVPVIGHANYYSEQISQGSLFQFQSEVIQKEAEANRCVFVGRGADYILRKMDNVVNLFVYADMDYKIEQVMKRHECSADEARRIIVNGEKQRAKYYNYYTGKTWGAKESYDICINSCCLGLEATAEYLAEFVEKKLKLK